jgi:hypothetical protein
MTDNVTPEEIQRIPVIEMEETPDLYVDGVMTTVMPYGVTVYLQRQDVDLNTMQPCNHVVGKLRMSHAQAWALAETLGRVVEQYMRDVGPIHLPDSLLDQTGLRQAYEEMRREIESGDR